MGLFQSIRPTVKYQPKKTNIVADALSRSQCPTAEEPNQAEEATAQKGVLLLAGSSVEPHVEDLQM